MKPKRILIIEDDPTFRRSIAAFLADYGYEVLEAPDGEQGLEMNRRQKPCLVLTDLRMPILDGFEVLSRVQQETPGTPVIVITGTGNNNSLKLTSERGACACISKPIDDLVSLGKAIENALA